MRRLFLLAHTDDEIFCLPFICEPGVTSYLMYFTLDSPSSNRDFSASRRAAELSSAVSVLNERYEVNSIFFDPLSPDGELHSNFSSDDLRKLRYRVKELEIQEIVTLSFEGGHQDHDYLAIVASLVGHLESLHVIHCPAYRGSRRNRKFFRVMNPIKPFSTKKFNNPSTILIAMRLILIYKSQYKTWLGLGPMTIFKYLKLISTYNEKYELDKLALHETCFYENRKRQTQFEVNQRIADLISDNLYK
jgi:hypothetical protein